MTQCEQSYQLTLFRHGDMSDGRYDDDACKKCRDKEHLKRREKGNIEDKKVHDPCYRLSWMVHCENETLVAIGGQNRITIHF